MINVSLDTLCSGELGAMFDYNLRKVMHNILDPNTPASQKRKIKIELTFVPDADRQGIDMLADVKCMLAAVVPKKTRIYVNKDIGTGQLFVNEYGSAIPGQMEIADFQTDEDGSGRRYL